MTYIRTKDLPQSVQNLLRSLEYLKADISVKTAETVTPSAGSGDGRQNYLAIVDLETGNHIVHRGSWGGANIASRGNIVDLDCHAHEIPANGLIIQGCTGYVRCAWILVRPESFQAYLTAPADVLDPLDSQILAIWKSYKPAYRRTAYELESVTDLDARLDSLVSRGFLKRNKAGSITLTLAGKNAAGKAPL